MNGLAIGLIVGLFLFGLVLGWIIRWLYARYQLSSSEQKAERLRKDAIKEAEAQKKEILLEARDQMIRERHQQEKEFRERRTEQQKFEKRILQKEENLERKLEEVEKRNKNLANQEAQLKKRELKLDEEEERVRIELEKVASISAEEAKQMIMKSLENEAKHDAQALINKIEHEAEFVADKKAKSILVSTMQRIASDVCADVTIASVSLPSDEMKGRIIGREGRNIRALETLTGVDIIIDDTPEAVVISCFDPIRKEIARIALERLIKDGRIHPARIEEVVGKVSKELNQTMFEYGEKVIFDLGIHNMRPDAIRGLGALHYRTSYGQNVLMHSKEVAVLSGMIAAEIGANREDAVRAGLLHDIGKGIESEGDSNHAELGAELAKRLGEKDIVVNAIASHHNDVEVKSVEAVIVQIADAISASRPGVRKETLESYIKRLENLEHISTSFDGVEKAFAIQAGRELRIVVDNNKLSDDETRILARDIAKKIETEMKYPGRIKITMIRETRVVEYAR
ncbi:MAG: ribonuclease Y [Spirochaetales bacterium]|nr:ribonuclease Y [Spirochaetales bacterium]